MYLFRYTRLHPFPTTAQVEVNLYNLYTTRRVRTAIYFVEIGTGSLLLLMRFFLRNSAAVIRSIDGRNASTTFLRKFRAAEITNNLAYTQYNYIVYCYYYYSYVTLKKRSYITFICIIFLPNHGRGNGSHHTYRHCVITSRPI